MKRIYKAGELAIFIPRYVSDERKKFIEEKIREEKEKAEKLKLEKEQNKNL
jgi:hypothetical protein